MNKLYRNWFVHNCFAHPLMYLVGLIKLKNIGEKIHDSTLPDSVENAVKKPQHDQQLEKVLEKMIQALHLQHSIYENAG